MRNRTGGAIRPETRDRRVQRTKTSLRDALIGLAREKPYGSIAVKDILDRANVGRSTFYTHFRDKDELLDSGIHEMLRSTHARPGGASAVERVLAFSLPVLQYVDEHRRRPHSPEMPREGRIVLHAHLQDVLASVIAEDVAMAMRRPESSRQLPAELVARHVAATFVLVLNWWVDSDVALTPAEVHQRFRSLVAPALSAP